MPAGVGGGGDFGRELGNLSMPVDTQRESAMDGRFSPKEPGWLVWDDASLCEQLHQAYLAFLIPAQRNHPHHPAVSSPRSHRDPRIRANNPKKNPCQKPSTKSTSTK